MTVTITQLSEAAWILENSSVFITGAGEMYKQELAMTAGNILLLGNLYHFLCTTFSNVFFSFAMQVLLIFHSSQVDIYIIKGEISSARLQNILSDIEMVKKTQPTYFFPHSPQKIAS